LDYLFINFDCLTLFVKYLSGDGYWTILLNNSEIAIKNFIFK